MPKIISSITKIWLKVTNPPNTLVNEYPLFKIYVTQVKFTQVSVLRGV